MPQIDIIHFDIAAVVVMLVTMGSLMVRHITSGPTNRVYFSAMVLVTITAIACLVGESYDALVIVGFIQPSLVPPITRDAATLIYYALRTLTAPAYLILIATVSSTTHRFNNNNFTRIALWTPMIAVLLLVMTNPLHHLVYYYEEGAVTQGSLIMVLYLTAAYYSIIGIAWLIRWRSVLSNDEFATLMMLYPLIFISVIIQYSFPMLHVEMFITSVAMMLVSAFVIRPEMRIDSLVNAASLPAYREMCRRALLTEKRLCLVYLEIVNLERLRELVGKDELQDVVRQVSANLASKLESDDSLYYLRNGLFCISPRNTDVDHALDIARQAHEEGKAKSDALNERSARTEMRTCIVRVPEDAENIETLQAFVRRFAHLVPESCVTTFSELSKQDGFGLQMALSDIVAEAIEMRSFTVHYQPIWCLKDNGFRSAEALVRLNDPVFGWVPPSLFVPEAEQNGSIVDIGSILLEHICTFLGTVDFERTGLHYVEVNLSADQCIRPELASELLELMHVHAVEPCHVNLEITESSSAYSQSAIEANIQTLSEAGIAFSLDDYGTGYSNTTRMLSLPFSLIKLDKSFVDGIDDPSTRIVLTETIAMMKSIGKDVLIEGVETREQVEALANMGVDYIQGYYYAKPMPEDEFVAFLLTHNESRN